MRRRFFIYMMLLFAVYGCHHSSQIRAFYYWRTTFCLSPKEEQYLNKLDVHKFYLRMFDVDWDEQSNSAKPIGKIEFVSKPGISFEYIPVVYLTNKTLQKINPGVIPDLASRIFTLVQSLLAQNKLTFTELQIDCDWSESTRDKYFYMLSILRKKLELNHQILSATIRLHQVKYAQITGIPPVQRGMLMYYNVGSIKATSGQNSIFNKSDAAKYIDFVSRYPLTLDVALPSFAWGVHIRNAKVVGLLNQMTSADFENNTNFKQTENVQFTANASFFYKGFYFMKDDKIKIESVSPELCLEAAQQLAGKLKSQPGSVAIFQLDTLMIKTYEEEKLEEVFDCFH